MRTLLATILLAAGITQASAVDGKLVLYTSQPNTDAQQTADAFMARHPGVTVEWVRDGTPKILAKLAAEIEAGQPQPDVLLIADVVTMEGLKKEGRLMAYPEADVSAFEDGLVDPDRTYFSTKLITTGIVYNTSAPFVPESWLDLTKPEAKGLVAMPSPLTSGAAMIHTVTLTGSLSEGWDYYGALSKNGAQASGGAGGRRMDRALFFIRRDPCVRRRRQLHPTKAGSQPGGDKAGQRRHLSAHIEFKCSTLPSGSLNHTIFMSPETWMSPRSSPMPE